MTKSDLLSLLVVGGSIANTVYPLLDGVRVRRVSIWDTTATLGALGTVSMTWVSPSTLPVTVSDSSVGTAVPMYISSAPPKGSLADDWIVDVGGAAVDTGYVLQMVLTANAVIDVECELALQNNYTGGTTSGISTTLSTSAGIVYQCYLDGIAAGSGLIPIGMPPMH